MAIFRFHFDTDLPCQLRDVVNEKLDLSIKKEHVLEKEKARYFAWDRICVIMDRLEDTISHINSLELGREEKRSAFDFYEFISCAAVVIDCIRYIGNIFGIDPYLVKQIEDTQDVFGSEYAETGNDKKFFEYIRSLCVTHPAYTNRHKEYLKGAKFHCCPFVTWSHFFGLREGDLSATIYTSKDSDYGLHLPLYINQFERYLEKWIFHIRDVIDAIHNYNESVYEKLRKEPVKGPGEFDDTVEYLRYLKEEYSRRFGDDNSYIFDEYIRMFEISLTNPQNQVLLEKYKNAILYAIGFLQNSMRNMSQSGTENTGIQYEDPGIETDLFLELSHISNPNSSFSAYSYNLEKVLYLEPESQYSYYDKLYARGLLEDVKEAINVFVAFNNNESDEETLVLISLAEYLDALSSKNILNKNIPNEEKYRVKVLSTQEWEGLFVKSPDTEKQSVDLSMLDEILKMYGQ